jgi:sugar phosphate isomerase/epimerase
MKKLINCVETAVWYEEDKPAESIRFIKECGFEAIDYNFGALFRDTLDVENLTSFYDKSLDELYEFFAPLKKALADNGIEMAQSHGLFPVGYVDNAARTAYNIEVTEKHIALCAYLGCPAIVIHGTTAPEITKEQERAFNLDMYRRLIPAAKKYGVKVCLENLLVLYDCDPYEGNCSNADEACWFLDTLNAEAGEEAFGFCFDVGHAVLTGANLYQYLVTLGKRLTVLHIQDNDGASDGHMLPFTQLERRGWRLRIDWEKFILGLREIGYEGPINFEGARGIRVLPEQLRKDGLIYLSAVGRYFRDRVAE